MEIGAKLKIWMTKNGRSILYVADTIHVSPKTIERILDGTTKHPIPVIQCALQKIIQENYGEPSQKPPKKAQ